MRPTAREGAISVPANNHRTCRSGTNALRYDQRSRSPRLHSILGHWLVDLRIVLRIVGELALDWMLDDTRG